MLAMNLASFSDFSYPISNKNRQPHRTHRFGITLLFSGCQQLLQQHQPLCQSVATALLCRIVIDTSLIALTFV
jgi:hypothetical protein